MTKKEELKQTYMKDVQMAASKSKFGFFNIPPPVSAGDQTFLQKKVQRDQNGKLKTEQRNIFSGISASGVLKKSYFSYPQYKAGDIYLDPGKADRQKQIKANKSFQEKEVFRPTMLNNTLNSASYQYEPQKQVRKNPKMYKNQDGKVITQSPNIQTNVSSEIEYKSLTQLKYVGQPYENARILRRKQLLDDISKRGQNAFKPSSPVKEYFATNKEKFSQPELPDKKEKKILYNIQQHDNSFRPTANHFNNGQFSYPKHLPNQNKEDIQTPKKGSQSDKKQPFKLIKQQKNSKPCPSISFSRMNMMRALR